MRFATKSPTNRLESGAGVPARVLSPRPRALSQRGRGQGGFTIVEMLIAMVITLLMMAALGRAFAVIGETIRVSRVEIDLSVQMREITRRLSDDLERCTVRGDREASQREGLGYFVYYDGPLSSASGTILGNGPTTENEQTLQDSKYSDFDDYIAFTAEAEKDNWFSGKVPRFILDMKSAALAGVPYDPANFSGSPLDPVVITSKYAEIVYFASPQYATAADNADPSQSIFVYDTTTGAGNPVPLDLDGNQIPDTIRLHRRVLLIRPDLNINGALAALSVSTGGVAGDYMAADAWPADTTTGHPAIKTPGTHGISVAQTGNAWLMGMSVVHQQCDLSVRRVLNNGGEPTAAVAANSLADLTFPHNRFAHVRAPSSAVGLTAPANTYGYTSMPLLAMGGPHALLVRASGESPAVVPAPPSSGAQVVTPLFLNGFLRPEFVLGQDLTHTDIPGDGWGIERRGEDVIASNIVGFDVRGFDPSAPVFLASGADGLYGPSGSSDTPLVAGATGSDDVAITPGDPGFFEVIRTSPLGTPPSGSGASDSFVAMRGAFVDLFYPFQAGGTLRGFGSVRRDRFVAAGTAFGADEVARRARANALVRSELSGYSPSNHQGLIDSDTGKPYRSYYHDSLFKSGRLVRSAAGSSGAILLVQPVYDTYTDGYERDGFRQDDGAAVGGAGLGTLWWLNDPTSGIPPVGPSGDFRHGVDTGNNGIYDGLSGISMGDGTGERETLPPFAPKMPAVQITLRTENQNTRQLQQMSVVNYFAE